MRHVWNAIRRATRRTWQPCRLLALAFAMTHAGGVSAQVALPLAPSGVSAKIDVQRPPLLSLDAIKRGTVGVGYTVFASARGPEPFEAHVLGVMRNHLGPGGDLIIAELRGEQIERTGVIAGMSGSPVYVDGKLIGAVGYRFGSFTRRPIAGITPIHDMLRTFDGAVGGAPVAPAASRVHATFGRAEPLSTPVLAPGMSGALVDALADKLQAAGLWPVQTGGGASGSGTAKTGPAARLYASGPIAGALVSGDANMTGVGTVTYVDGDRFLAFGHPFLGRGPTEMPVWNAEIVTTVASAAGSWKMGQATTEVGRLTEDRLFAIAGTMGTRARTAGLTVRLTTDPAAPERVFSYRVVNHREETALLTAITTANTLSGRTERSLGGTVRVSGTVTLASGEVHHFARVLSAAHSALEVSVAFAVLGELDALLDPLGPAARLDMVDVSIARAPEAKNAEIASVRTRTPAIAGAPLGLQVTLRTASGALEERTASIALPKTLAGKPIWVRVAGRRAAWRTEMAAGERPTQPRDAAEAIARVTGRIRDDEVVVFLLDQSVSPAGTAGATGPLLPTWDEAWSGQPRSGEDWTVLAIRGRHTTSFTTSGTPMPIEGSADMRVMVRAAAPDWEGP